MPTDREALLLQISADVSGLQKQFAKATGVVEQSTRQMERRAQDAAGKIERSFGGIRLPNSLRRELNDFGRDLGAGLAGASRTAQLALAGVSAYAIKLAADAAEVESAFDVAFKTASAAARKFSDELGGRVGRDAVEIREAMTRLQLVLTGTGVAGEQAAQVVERLVALGIDAGSLFNTSDAEAFQKIISGLTGETEPLKAFGVVINEAAVKAELLRLGFKGSAQEASEAAKSIARANLIVKGLAVAQGDAERTSGSAANQMRRLRAEANAAARDLGEQLLPSFIKVAGAATDTLRAFNDLPSGVQAAGVAFLGLIAAGGPIAGVIANLNRVIDLANKTKVAIANAAGGAGAAAGGGAAAGRAAGAVAGAGVAGGISLGAVLGIPLIAGGIALDGAKYHATLRNPGKATEEELRAAVVQAQDYVRTTQGAASERPLRDLGKLLNEESRRNRERLAKGAAVAGTGAGVVGGFTLPESLKTPTGPSKAGGRTKTAKADDPDRALDAAERAIADIMRKKAQREREALDIALAGLDAQGEAAEIAAQLATTARERRAAELKLLHLADRRAAAELDAVINSETVSRAEKAEARIRRQTLRDTRAGREAVVEQRTQGPLEGYLASLRDLDEFVQTEAIGAFRALNDEMGQTVARTLGLGGALGQLVGSLISALSQRATSGLFAAVAGAIPGFAGGTNYAPGGMAWVGERGPELVNLPRGAQVLPNDMAKRLAGASVPVVQHFHADFKGAVVTEDLIRSFQAYANGAAAQAVGAARAIVPADLQRKSRKRFY